MYEALQTLIVEALAIADIAEERRDQCTRSLSAASVSYLDALGVFGEAPDARRAMFRAYLADETLVPDAWLCGLYHEKGGNPQELAILDMVGTDNGSVMQFIWRREAFWLWLVGREVWLRANSPPPCALVQQPPTSASNLFHVLRHQNLTSFPVPGRGDLLVASLAFLTRQKPNQLAKGLAMAAASHRESWSWWLQAQQPGLGGWDAWATARTQWQHGRFLRIVADGMGRTLYVLSVGGEGEVTGTLYTPLFTDPPPNVEPLLCLYMKGQFRCICPVPPPQILQK